MKVIKRPRLFSRRAFARADAPEAAASAEAVAQAEVQEIAPRVEPLPGEVPVVEEEGGGETPTRPGDAPTRRRRWIGPLQIAVVLALVVVAVVVSRAPTSVPAPGPGGPGAAGPVNLAPLVRIVVPAPVSTLVEVEATGTIDVRSYVALTPQVGGRIVSVSESLRAGGEFAANQILLTIDPRDFELGLEQARAEVASAEADLRLRLAESDAARSNYAILHPGQRVPPLVARIPQIAQARARLEGARARLAVTELDFTRSRFALPFAGKVTETTAEVGQMLTRNQPFGQAFAFDALEAVAPVAQDELARLEPVLGRGATVRAPGVELEATVERVSAELDARTRFAKLYLALPPEAGIAPGTFVDVTVEGPLVEDTFLLPDATEQAGGHVWRVVDGRLQRQELSVLGRSSEGLVVRAFDPGEGVVTGAAPGAREGLSVRVARPGGTGTRTRT